ncbi:aspartate/glutamate racemase family protein [Flavobacterium cupreum]|uniref:Aspartate racemase n=2 Tax=Flavobacterium TaxID=237 RepID=A0A4Y7UE84_9FLAO|nr:MULTISPECIES: aspartate/glutamate racemase family protein [Flavobacterium]RUT67919.1 aspartate/glutamate racemase family protein [Flavobacterium cupreum]TCN59481.1 aspartate racemase [Flavobacterium circumlabens]TEB44780.1 aspartate/glutamate racemase family protein [Flavobacterium circumlabens]
MQTIGLIGGISWVSTVDYYKLINQGINEKLGGLNYSQCLIYSFNYADIKKNNDINDWETTFKMVLKACNDLKFCGAKAIVLCANTMHFLADRLENEIGLPIIHIATATATEIEKKRLKKVGLLGTKFTMELDFFKSKLADKGIATIIPNDADREFVHNTIFEELGKGLVTAETKKRYLKIIEELVENGAEGIILGCTEIPLVIHQNDVKVPVFDTALLHSKAAIEFQLS